MKKKTDLKKLLENRNVLIGIAAACAVGILLAVILFSLVVFDSVNMRSSVNVKTQNTVGYTVRLTPDADDFFPQDTLGAGGSYLLRFTDAIMVTNRVEAQMSKNVSKLTYTYTMVQTFVVRSQGNGNPVVLSRPETIDLLHDPDLTYLEHNFDSLEITYANPIPISLTQYQEDFRDFEKAVRQESPSVRLSGELVVEFRLTLDDGNNLKATITRGIVIPFTSETYRINFTGQDAREQDFPERNIELPALPVTILVILVVTGLIYGLNASLKKAFYEKDNYKREIKTIFKKSIDAIITAAPNALVPNFPIIDVVDFKELAKASQTLNKPIVYYEESDAATFYVVCDFSLYRFKLIKNDPIGDIIPK